jgi:YgiT-type zinc finger domain-containing protein
MKCALCNNQVVKSTGSVKFDIRSLGKISIPNLEYFECKACGDQLLAAEQSDKAFEFITNQEQELVEKLPIGEFITANDAAVLLDISKQAFSKNPKIKRGLIFSTNIGDRKYYHKKSVELFKDTGNGKFLLTPQMEVVPTFQHDEYIGAEADHIYGSHQAITVYGDITVKAHSSFEISESETPKFTTNATSDSFWGICSFENITSIKNPLNEADPWLLAMNTEKLL